MIIDSNKFGDKELWRVNLLLEVDDEFEARFLLEKLGELFKDELKFNKWHYEAGRDLDSEEKLKEIRNNK